MTKDTQKAASLGDAAYAADVQWTRLRHWLDRSQIKLDADATRDEGGKHRRFYFLDIVRIAIVGKLVRFGMTAERADKLVAAVIASDPGAPPAAQVRNWKAMNVAIYVAFDEKKGDFVHSVSFKGEDLPDIQRREVMLVIDLPKVAQRVLDRLKEVSI